MTDVDHLARIGHGAIQVDAADPDHSPVKIFLGGPIKHWWSLPDEKWDTGDHHVYLLWRDAVEAALVQAGFLVYKPFDAWRGSWHEDAQEVNNAAISISDVFINLTPPGVPNVGTQTEEDFAIDHGIRLIVSLPPGDADTIDEAVTYITETLHEGI